MRLPPGLLVPERRLGAADSCSARSGCGAQISYFCMAGMTDVGCTNVRLAQAPEPSLLRNVSSDDRYMRRRAWLGLEELATHCSVLLERCPTEAARSDRSHGHVGQAERVQVTVVGADVDHPVGHRRRGEDEAPGGEVPQFGPVAASSAYTLSSEPTQTTPLATAGAETTTSPVAKLQSRSIPETVRRDRTFSVPLWPWRSGRSWNCGQSVATVKLAWANSRDWRPSAEIEWVPGVAAAGTVTEMGPKLPVGSSISASWAAIAGIGLPFR